MDSISFEQMHLSQETLRVIHELQYDQPTSIQQETILPLMQGYDLIGQSQTGTGKTLAFAIPLIERIEPMDRDLQAVILVPTRELCVQTASELRKLLKYHASIRVLSVYGGQPIDQQIRQLKGGVQIVVATPGRFMDHLRRHTLKVGSVHMVVLDEADEMLDMGFREDIESILQKMPPDRQTMLFSATMPEEILSLADTFLKNPVRVKTIPDTLTPQETEEIYYDLKEKMKPEALKRILEMDEPALSLVFCNTKKRVEMLCARMKELGISAGMLHGDLNQNERDTIMKQFRAHEIPLLIATDVAARGLDIENIDLVVNYDVPEQVEFYVHRVGRTGRAGKKGRAVTFVVGRELTHLQEIMQYTGHTIPMRQLPTLSDINEKQALKLSEDIRGLIQEDPWSHTLDQGRSVIHSMMEEGYDAADIAAALWQISLRPSDDTDFDLNIDRNSRGFPITSPEEKPDTMVTVWFDVGTRQHVRAKDIVGIIGSHVGLSSRALGKIEVHENDAEVEVPSRFERDVMKLVSGESIHGYVVHVSKDRPPRESKKHKKNPSGSGKSFRK